MRVPLFLSLRNVGRSAPVAWTQLGGRFALNHTARTAGHATYPVCQPPPQPQPRPQPHLRQPATAARPAAHTTRASAAHGGGPSGPARPPPALMASPNLPHHDPARAAAAAAPAVPEPVARPPNGAASACGCTGAAPLPAPAPAPTTTEAGPTEAGSSPEAASDGALDLDAASSAGAPDTVEAAPPLLPSPPPPPPLGPPYAQIVRSDYLRPGPLPPGRRVYLILLNYTLPPGLLHVWSLASFRVCADGGCNRLYDQLPSLAGLARPPSPPQAAAAGVPVHSAGPPLAAGPGGPARAAAAPGVGPTTTPAACNGAHPTSSPAAGHAAAADAPGDPHDAPTTLPTAGGTAPTASGLARQPGPPPSSGRAPAPAPSPGTAAPPPPPDPDTALRLAHLPDMVLGDLDSLRADVRQFYLSYGVPFLDQSADQDSTDLTKAVALLAERFVAPDPDTSPGRHQILVLGALGGRLDHCLAALNTLHMFPALDIALWGEGNLVRLVRPGGAALITPDEGFEGPTCGLIPIAGPVTASSRGLRWDLADTHMHVGGLVSSSNLLTGGPVQVVSDGPLLWTTELREEPQPDAVQLWERVAAAAVERAAAATAVAMPGEATEGGGDARA